LKLEQMNEGDELFPSMETRKRKRRSRFRFSSKKTLECSRLMRRTAKAGGCEFTSVIRTLLYPSVIPSELCVTDIHGCAAKSCESPILESIDKFERERKETSNGD
jgi:hypothetical protein